MSPRAAQRVPEASPAVQPARGLVYVRPIRTAEQLGSGRIALLDGTRAAWTHQQAEVVSVGRPDLCVDVDCARPHRTEADRWNWVHPCRIATGDWVILEPRSQVDVEDGLWAIRQDQVLARIVEAS